jgi:hypothetical protein
MTSTAALATIDTPAEWLIPIALAAQARAFANGT